MEKETKIIPPISLTQWQETIVALATPAGQGAISIIRISGEKAIPIIQLFFKKKLFSCPSHTLHVGNLYSNQQYAQVIDEVMIALFKSPHSYTGEDMIEINCHGSPYIQETILQMLIQAGARLAKPGEFTLRAFLNKKIDLTQAESVADLIACNSKASAEAALHKLKGKFAEELMHMRSEMIRFSSLLELELDFSQEDISFANRNELLLLLQTLTTQVRKMLLSFTLGNVLKEGVQVAIVGKPNAGKSTLLNTLLQKNRAIVSDIPGTTRDTIEEKIQIEGIWFNLIDTAGLRNDSHDTIEQMGIQKSKETMQSADLILYVFDAQTTSPPMIELLEQQMQEEKKQYILVGNKVDIASTIFYPSIIWISAKKNKGIDILTKTMRQKVYQGEIDTHATILTNVRHYEALQKLDISLQEVQKAMENNIPTDLITIDIKQCLAHLGEITGAITHNDQLDFIFSKFCIGK